MFHLDWETKSCAALDEVGLHNYVTDPSTEILMGAFCRDSGKVKQWQPHLESLPAELEDALLDPFTVKVAWNAPFERAVAKHQLGIDIPLEELYDPMIHARYLSIPGSLDEAGKILGLKADEVKSKEGSRLIKLFCEPAVRGGEQTLFGISKPAFRNWQTDPSDWSLFLGYNRQDVVAEKANLGKMSRFPVPEKEWANWIREETINGFGLPIDLDLVSGALKIVDRATKDLLKKLKDLTQLDNPNSNDQMLNWLQSHGYTFGSMEKAYVNRALNGECALDDDARAAIIIRQQTSKSSVKKYTGIGQRVSSDGRLRGSFSFMGASRTQREASRGINLQNLPRPSKKVSKRMDLAVELVQKGDYEGIIREFEDPLDVVSSTIRAALKAPKGFKFVVADLNAIENRVVGYLAKCDAILRVFREGRDPYLDFACYMYNQDYATLLAEYEAGDTTKRTNCKAPILGCSYGLSGGKEEVDANGDRYFSGLVGYAKALGIEMSLELAHESVRVFREKFPEVVQFWYAMEAAAVRAVRHPGVEQSVGDAPLIRFLCVGKSMLQMFVPGGTSLNYVRPQVHENTYISKRTGKPYKKATLSYEGKEQGTANWTRIETFGSHLVENATQKVARDVLWNGIALAQGVGFSVVGHVHDEVLTLVPDNSNLTLEGLVECMKAPLDWAGSALPLDASGYVSEYYKKG